MLRFVQDQKLLLSKYCRGSYNLSPGQRARRRPSPAPATPGQRGSCWRRGCESSWVWSLGDLELRRFGVGFNFMASARKTADASRQKGERSSPLGARSVLQTTRESNTSYHAMPRGVRARPFNSTNGIGCLQQQLAQLQQLRPAFAPWARPAAASQRDNAPLAWLRAGKD